MTVNTIITDYETAKAKGFDYKQMINNLDARAKSLGHALAECIQGSIVHGEIDEIAWEASELKAYRAAFIDFLFVELAKGRVEFANGE